jgi:threonine dehydrogenase-like Zn-dependent dehydrogenase
MRTWRPTPGGDTTKPALYPGHAEPPEIRPDQVLLEVRGAVFGAPERLQAGAHIPGGAAVGEVVRAGEHAVHLMGKRVLVGPEQGCGECDICRRGEPASCPQGEYLGRTSDGCLAQFASARARWACVLGDELSGPAVDSPAAALLAREAAWAYTMFARAGVAPGEPVFIVGGTVVARFLVEIAVAKGVRPMVLHEPDAPAFARWIEDRGAIPVLSPVGPSQAEPFTEPLDHVAVRQFAETVAADNGHGRRPSFIFETSAVNQARLLALALMVPGGKATLLSRRALGFDTLGPKLELDLVTDVGGTLIGVAGAHPDLLPEVAALAVRGVLDITGAARVVAVDERPAELPALDPALPEAWVLALS